MGGSLGQLYGAHLFTLVPGVINCEYHQDYGDGFSYIGPYICICVLVAKMGIMISIELKLRVEEFMSGKDKRWVHHRPGCSCGCSL